MGLAKGVHHLAISTADLQGQLDFFTEVLGAELAALYWMHGAEKTVHAFVKLDDTSYLAFVTNEEIEQVSGQAGVSHAGSYTGSTAGGTMQHVALSVPNESDLLDLRDRIRAHGCNVFGPLDHGYCKSIYFAGPEGLLLEAAWSPAAIDDRAWIDPEAVAFVGIEADKLARYCNPAPHRGTGGRVPQPPIDLTKPHFQIPLERLERIMTTPDDVITETMSDPEPPVKAQS